MTWPPGKPVESVARFNHNFRMGVPVDPEHYQIYADLYNIN